MKRLLLITFLVGGINQLSQAQPCKTEVITLKSKIEANPDSVLYVLGDAITLQPNCLGDFVETAIVAAKPNPDTLTQIIRLAVSQYPDEVGTIAEAAVLAAPENVDVIRKAFQPQPIIAMPVLKNAPSPIENFIAGTNPNQSLPTPTIPNEIEVPGEPATQSLEFKTSQYDPQDVAEKAMKTIDELLARLKNPGTEKKETSPAGAPTEDLFGESQKVETFRLNLTDEMVAITSLDDAAHRDEFDELVTTPSANPPVFKDPVTETPPVNLNAPVITEKKAPKVAPDRGIEFSSSVYHIPSSADLLAEEDSTVAPIVIRSVSASPTTPQVR